MLLLSVAELRAIYPTCGGEDTVLLSLVCYSFDGWRGYPSDHSARLER